jgi:eukaryotic-like serine/threonine-protein kinase
LALTSGTRLGPYEIVALLGIGGMGEVYRARDTKLNREVAIKTLPESFAKDPERLARFSREAQVLAALNHPNIAHIHGFEESTGVPALVMELVEGPTLADRIARGPIPMDEALMLAKQVADALEAAHEQAIIHRDLKPANIKVRKDGTVKVLDFGLAKALATESAATVTVLGTATGVVLGTPAYMSPEQARGETADRQADIWSFGVVFYELLTGVSAFGRSTTAETLAALLGAPPDFSQLPTATPLGVRALIRRALEKDRRRRWRDMGDVRIELDEATASASDVAGHSVSATRVNARRTQAVGAIALVVLASAGTWYLARLPRATTAARVVRLSISTQQPLSGGPVSSRHVAVSADGSRVAYVTATGLHIRRLDRKDDVTVNTVARNPFFSPDGEWVAFFGDDRGLGKVPSAGGTPVPIVTSSDRPAGATWRPDGTIVFATSTGLYQVSENGGAVGLLRRPDVQRKERLYAWPRFLPNGRLLFTIVPDDSIDGAQIAALDLKTGAVNSVLKGGSAAQYTSTGHLVYASGRTLKAVAFDPETLQTHGDAVPLLDVELTTAPDNGAADFALSETGTLLFLPPATATQRLQTLMWVNRQGSEEPLALQPGQYNYPRISPDGTRLAFDIPGANRDIWLWSLRRRNLMKLTDGPTEDMTPLWTPDGQRIFFASNRSGIFHVYSQAADGSTKDRVEFAGPGSEAPTSITPDGTRVLIVENFKDLSVLNLAQHRVEPLLHSERNHWQGVVSPDGKWLAYESDEASDQIEIFVRPFPDVGGRREKVSLKGGRFPLWAPNGGELYYVDPDGGMMAASVTLLPDLRLGQVVKLFDTQKPPRGISGRPYDVSRVDGRFLMGKPVSAPDGVDISVVLNWLEELQQRVPAK